MHHSFYKGSGACAVLSHPLLSSMISCGYPELCVIFANTAGLGNLGERSLP